MEKVKLEVALGKTITPNKIRESLLDNEFMSDVTFLLGSEESQLKAHKIFLMTSSPVFHKLLTENNEERLNIKINQISKPIMLELCRYAYTDDVKFSSDNMLDILFAASKFEMRFLMEKTIDYICKHQMNEMNVFKILESNQKYNNLRISLKCFEFIEKSHQKCFKNADFLKISNELLRTIMTTCKIPHSSAKMAIESWSKVNNFDDLDELMGLISMNESSNNSDTESVASSKVSGSTKNNRNRRDRSNRGRSRPRNQNANFSGTGGGNIAVPFAGIMANQNLQQLGLKSFLLMGNTTRKNFKFANLDISSATRNVFLHSLMFVYDFKTTDTEFEISMIGFFGNSRKTLYSDKVVMNMRSNGPFNSYQFMGKVLIPAGIKIWIRIEFPKQEFRLTFDKFNNSVLSTGNDIILQKDNSYNSYAEVISAIFYSLS